LKDGLLISSAIGLGRLRQKGWRKLYIRRRSRKPVNEELLISIASSFGFEIFWPEEDQDQQIAVFREAAFVVGPHGAALANVAFCPPQSKILEFVPSDYALPYIYTLCVSSGLGYAHIVGQSEPQREADPFGSSQYDFLVDAGTFQSALTNFCQN
jgi:capsular polysaccharide biosynthesis protein